MIEREFYEVVILTSYCDPELDPDCTNEKPCKACLGLSNVFRIPQRAFLKNSEYVRELAPEWNYETLHELEKLLKELE